MSEKTIYQSGKYRIIEAWIEDGNIDDLKGDCFVPEHNPDIDLVTLLKEETAFEQSVIDLGVFGYCLEVWNAGIGEGWTHVDSCYGFIGEYDSKLNNHYIVDELKEQMGVS